METPKARPNLLSEEKTQVPKVKKLSLETINKRLNAKMSDKDGKAEKSVGLPAGEEILSNEQDALLKPLKSNRTSSKMKDSHASFKESKIRLETPKERRKTLSCSSQEEKSDAHTNQNQTLNVNIMMSTVKVTDLKLHLN